MPSTNQYDSRRPVAVKPFATCGILYGFLTNVNAATSTSCGHVDMSGGTLPVNLVFGASAPQPGRASKLVSDEYNSSFYDHASAAALRAAGWRLSRPTIRRARSGPRSKCVYVTLAAGVKYAWNMPAALHGLISADLTGLGIRAADATEKDLVFGARNKPPKAFKGDGATSYTTFYDPSVTLPTGWASAGSGGREQVGVDE